MHSSVKIILTGLIIVICIVVLLRVSGIYFSEQISPLIENKDSEEEYTNKFMVGEEIPYFSLLLLSGEKVNKTDLLGYPNVIMFWSTWNSSSVDQMKIVDDYFSSISPSKESKLPRFIAINSQESKPVVENLMRRGNYNIDVLLDINGEISNAYGIRTLPTTFFINSEGVLVEKYIGTMNVEEFISKMENIIR